MNKPGSNKNHLSAETVSISLMLLLFAALLACRLIAVFSTSADLAGVESNVVYSIIRLLDTGKLYADPARIPFSITQYTPVYYYTCASVARIIYEGRADNIYQIYVIGRSLNLLFNLVTVLGLYKIGSIRLNLSPSHCAMLCLCCFGFMFPHNFVVRPDSLQDTFAIWSVYYFSTSVGRDQRTGDLKFLALALMLAAGAVFTKQNGLQLMAVFVIYYCFQKNWKMAGLTALLSILLVGVLLLTAMRINSSFIPNVVGGIENGIDFKNFFLFIVERKIFMIQIFPFIVLAVVISSKHHLIFKGTPLERFLCISVIGTLLFALLTSLKKGSDLQYYIVFSDLTLLLIFYFLQKISASLTPNLSSRLRYLTYATLNVMMLTYVLFVYQTITRKHGSEVMKTKELAANRVAVYFKSVLHLKPGEYVFANLSTDYTLPPRGNINTMLAANCVVPQLDVLNFSTDSLKIFGYTNFTNCLSNGTIKYIIESEPANNFIISEKFRLLETKNYTPLSAIGGYRIYKYSGDTNLTE